LDLTGHGSVKAIWDYWRCRCVRGREYPCTECKNVKFEIPKTLKKGIL